MTANLHMEIAGTGPAILAIHGFTGDSETLTPITKHLAKNRTVITVDLPGHGKTGLVEKSSYYQFDATVDSLNNLLERLGYNQVDILGYSFGGRLALALAIHYPTRIKSSILISTSAGIENKVLRSARQRTDNHLAQELIEKGIEWFVDYWMELPLFSSQKRLSIDMQKAAYEQRLRNDPRGLANSLIGAGVGNQNPLWKQLEKIPGRVLLIVGEEDNKFRSLAIRLASGLKDAEISLIPEAGHTCFLENPLATINVIDDFLDQGIK